MPVPDLLLSGLVLASTAGAAWGGVKVSLNGTRTRVKEIKSDLEAHRRDLQVHMTEEHTDYKAQSERLARVETKIDLLLQGKSLN